MYRSTAPQVKKDGVAGNSRLTGGMAAVLLVLLAAEGVTIPFLGSLLEPHILIGMLLIPPVALKLLSTGHRFVRYYSGNPAYVHKGPPPLPLRLLAPGVVLTTVVLFGTGVALLLAGPPGNTLIFLHKLSFVAWVALMTAHVLGHLLEVPRLASSDWRRGASQEARLAGAGARVAAIGISILAGGALALISVSAARPWL